MDPVIAAAAIAFGFVYIHPFEDGNGRVHRWLIHHVLSRAGYNPPATVFPVSAVMLRGISEYKRVLESYTRPLLRLIEWHSTLDNNVEVVNDTADYYRYFDATLHAEFLYHCVETTVEHDLPEEVAYLEGYDRFVRGVQEIVDMPASTLDLLHRFLHQSGACYQSAPAQRSSRSSGTRRSSASNVFIGIVTTCQIPRQRETSEPDVQSTRPRRSGRRCRRFKSCHPPTIDFRNGFQTLAGHHAGYRQFLAADLCAPALAVAGADSTGSTMADGYCGPWWITLCATNGSFSS